MKLIFLTSFLVKDKSIEIFPKMEKVFIFSFDSKG